MNRSHRDAAIATCRAGRLSGLVAAALATCLGSLPAVAVESPTFEAPHDAVLMWAQRAGLGAMVLSVALLTHVLLRRRDRMMEPLSKWLLFVGLVVLPVPVAFLSSGVGFEESKAVNFCASCHKPMGPFVADMKDPDSEHLAAVHFKNMLIQENQCWTCHSEYGVAGTVTAKLRGLGHITRVALDQWEAPVKLNRPYDFRTCLRCHGPARSFAAPREDPSAHEGVLEGVLEGTTACTECHELAHPKRELRSTK